MRQESLKVPTLVNGKNETVKVLKHGSKISLSDGTGFVLNSQVESLNVRKRRRILWMALTCVALAGIAATAWLTMM